MKLKPNDFRKLVVASFLAVPALSSLISTIHIVEFFGLGNQTWMAVILALAFEIGSIASLMTLAVLDKINRFAVWFIFIVLLMMQMLGNVYYTYDFISLAMSSNPTWIQSFVDLVEMMTMQKLEPRTTKFILSLLIGLPIPIISLAFLKSVSDYLKPDNKEITHKIETVISNKEENIIEEIKGEIEEIKDIVEETQEITEENNSKLSEIELEMNEDSVQDIVEQLYEPYVKENISQVEESSEKIEEHNEIIETQEQVFELPQDVIEEKESSEETSGLNDLSVDEQESKDEIDLEKEEDESSISENFFDDETEIEKNDNFVSGETETNDEKKSQL